MHTVAKAFHSSENEPSVSAQRRSSVPIHLGEIKRTLLNSLTAVRHPTAPDGSSLNESCAAAQSAHADSVLISTPYCLNYAWHFDR
jgi:hypothetical protein